MNILLANAWHDDNRGDSALVLSALYLLRNKYPSATIQVLSMIPRGHAYEQEAHRAIKADFPQVEILPSPFPMSAGEVRIGNLLPLVCALLSVFLPFLSRFSGLAKVVNDQDLVVGVGGHYLFTINNNLKSLFRLLRLTQVFTLATHKGIDTCLFSQSLGPYEGKLANRVMRRLLERARVIVREPLSEQLVKGIAPTARVSIAPDSAFYFGSQLAEEQIQQRTYAVFTLREPMKGDTAAVRARYIEQLSRAAKQLLDSGVVEEIRVFPHVIGPTQLEDDRAISSDFVELCAHAKVVLVTEPLTIKQSLDMYRNAKVVLGTRFHSVVFALCQQTPSVAIAYYGPKAQGIMRYIGLEHLCLDINTVTADEVIQRIGQALTEENQAAVKVARERTLEALEQVDFRA